MSDTSDPVPDTSNFFSSLTTDLSRGEVVALFGDQGWHVRKCGWTEYEVRCAWAELVIEAETPILMHGPVADVLKNAAVICQILSAAKVSFTAESYDEAHELLEEFAG